MHRNCSTFLIWLFVHAIDISVPSLIPISSLTKGIRHPSLAGISWNGRLAFFSIQEYIPFSQPKRIFQLFKPVVVRQSITTMLKTSFATILHELGRLLVKPTNLYRTSPFMGCILLTGSIRERFVFLSSLYIILTDALQLL